MNEQNSMFIFQDSCLIKDETDKFPDHNLILLDSIKEEITYQNNDENNESYYIDENVINKSNNIILENSNVDEINVLANNTEKYDSKTDILIINDNLIKEEINIKEEILTYLNGVGDNETNHIENVMVNYNKSNNVTIETLNIFKEIKTEKDCTNTSLQNTNSSLLCSINAENIFTKIEQMSPEGCDIFTENIFEMKTESDYKTNIIETSSDVLKRENKDVNKHNIIHLKSITNSDKEQYKHDICKQPCIHNGDLKNHIFTNNRKKHYICNFCQKSFTLKSYLSRHLFAHTGENPYKCDICQKSFTFKQNLNRHIFTHTGKKPHKCDICHKSFTRKNYINNHMFTHTGEKPYKCDVCQKSFTFKQNLNRHIFTHTGKKPHKCDICHKSFTRKDYLNNHMFIHTDKSPHKCDICHKSFTRKNNLNNHMFTHTGEKPYKCYICHKSFTQKYMLNNHMFTHSGKKPYKCGICHKSFAIQKILKRHILIHTGKNLL